MRHLKFNGKVSSLEFLLSCNFDLNKWASKGISFVNHDDQEAIQSRLDLIDNSVMLKEGDEFYQEVQDAIEKVWAI